jgi:CO/xanthine dehydrogenase FAD-binding subunit
MALLHEYHRPRTLDEAVTLLAQRDRRLLPLGGGTKLVGLLELGALPGVDGVVDLQDLGLAEIRREGEMLCLGAMATLSAVVEHAVGGSLADGLLRRAAQGEGPVNLRNAATVGGVVAAAEYDSEFYTALLALDARVTVRDGHRRSTLALAQFGPPKGLVVEVCIAPGARRGGAARVARTPADRPIVAAYATVGDAGERVALCGVAARPVMAGAELVPPSDFKGSAEYRQAMAAVVAARALAEAKE